MPETTTASAPGEPVEVDGSVMVGATPPDPPQEMPSRRATILRSSVVIGILVVVFGIILPKAVDYGEVVQAFQDLTLQQILLMSGIGLIAWVLGGLPFKALIPPLSVRRATTAYLVLCGIAASIPFGPWNMGVVWVVLRGWGVAVKRATSAIALYGVMNELSLLALPAIAAVVMAISAASGVDLDGAIPLTIISTVALILVSSLLIAIVKSDRTADSLGHIGQRLATSVVRRLGRSDQPDVDLAIHRFRDQAGAIVRERGLLTVGSCILYRLAWCVVLIVALRVVGVPENVLAPSQVLAVYALVAVITLIPLSPGGAGIPELLYIAGLSTIAGANYESLITAGVFLFRLYQWFLPIPVTWILLKLVRKGRPILPTTAELRSYARDEPAATTPRAAAG
jgi:uncharacterized membrane protein YbhN (UPF0104 family)